MGLKDLKNKILGKIKLKDKSVGRKPTSDEDTDQNETREESSSEPSKEAESTTRITEKMKGVSVNDEDSSSGPSEQADSAPTYASPQQYQDQTMEWEAFWRRHASSDDPNWRENMMNDIVAAVFKPPN